MSCTLEFLCPLFRMSYTGAEKGRLQILRLGYMNVQYSECVRVLFISQLVRSRFEKMGVEKRGWCLSLRAPRASGRQGGIGSRRCHGHPSVS